MKKYAVVLVFFLAILITYKTITINKNNDRTEIHIIPGSKSDCTIVLGENKSLILLDDFIKDIDYIKKHIFNEKNKNELLIVTYDEKYLENYTELLQEVEISKIYYRDKEGVSEFIEKAKSKNIKTLELNKDKVFNIDHTKVYFKIEKSEPLVHIKHPELSMLCLYGSNTKYGLGKIDILKLANESRAQYLNTAFLNKNKTDTLILTGNEPITAIEINQIKKMDNEIKVISGAKEGNIIYYKKEKGFGVTSESNMKIRIQ